jgi:hypothetical protein
MSTKLKFWIAGIAVIVVGLVLARGISPLYTDQVAVQLAVFLVGVLVAMAGLGIILIGLRK